MLPSDNKLDWVQKNKSFPKHWLLLGCYKITKLKGKLNIWLFVHDSINICGPYRLLHFVTCNQYLNPDDVSEVKITNRCPHYSNWSCVFRGQYVFGSLVKNSSSIINSVEFWQFNYLISKAHNDKYEYKVIL